MAFKQDADEEAIPATALISDTIGSPATPDGLNLSLSLPYTTEMRPCESMLAEPSLQKANSGKSVDSKSLRNETDCRKVSHKLKQQKNVARMSQLSALSRDRSACVDACPPAKHACPSHLGHILKRQVR